MNIFNRRTIKYLKVASEEIKTNNQDDVEQLSLEERMNICDMIYNFFFPVMYKYKIDVIANKMPIKDIPAENQTYQMCKIAVQHDGYSLKYICTKYRSHEICKLAVKQNSMALEYVFLEYQTGKRINIYDLELTLHYWMFDIQSELLELCYLAFEQNKFALCYIPAELQTKELCKLAIQDDARSIMNIAPVNQTYEMCKFAVQQNAFNLTFIHRQTEELCKLAIQKNPNVFHFINETKMKNSLNEYYNDMLLLNPSTSSRLIINDDSTFILSF